MCLIHLYVMQYLQVFFIVIDIVQAQNVVVFDQLHDGDLPLNLGGEEENKLKLA